MESKPTTRNRGIAAWMDDFIKRFANDNSKLAASIKESDINVHNLPKVVWNDETYYVDFNNSGAVVYNQFANEVTTVKGAHTVEDVDKALNDTQVVASSNVKESFDEALIKALGALDKKAGEFDPAGTIPNENGDASVTPDMGDGTEPATTPTPDQDTMDTAPVSDGSTPDTTTTPDPTQVTAEDDMGTQSIGDMIDSVPVEGSVSGTVTVADNKVMDAIAALQEEVRKLADLNNLAPIPQEYARHDLKEVGYPTDEMEQKHFGPEADATMEEIKQEDSNDFTTPEGRTTMFKRLVPKETGYAEQVYNTEPEAAVVPGVNEDHDPAENNKPTVEPPAADNADEGIAEEAETLTEQNAEESTEKENHNEPLDSATKNPNEEGKGDKPQVAKLAGASVNIFKNAVCPDCGHKKLTLASAVGNYQGVFCASCDSEYAVDTETEDIYKKN